MGIAIFQINRNAVDGSVCVCTCFGINCHLAVMESYATSQAESRGCGEPVSVNASVLAFELASIVNPARVDIAGVLEATIEITANSELVIQGVGVTEL